MRTKISEEPMYEAVKSDLEFDPETVTPRSHELFMTQRGQEAWQHEAWAKHSKPKKNMPMQRVPIKTNKK